MRAIRAKEDLAREVTEAKREAKAAFGKDEVYLEKLIERARHVEVQVLGDTHGNAVHLFERDCSIQRRNQKVVERAPAPYLDAGQRAELSGYALKIAEATAYVGAGTVEFLMDADTGKFYFIEVNPRIQVEHTVTEPDAVTESEGEIILLIDEIHLLVGAGRTQGAMDAANLLKPYLARGKLHCVGATTLEEYRRYVEKDAALTKDWMHHQCLQVLVLLGRFSQSPRVIQCMWACWRKFEVTDPNTMVSQSSHIKNVLGKW